MGSARAQGHTPRLIEQAAGGRSDPQPRAGGSGLIVQARFLALIAAVTVALSGCGIYLKTYRFKGPGPFVAGMTEEDVLNRWGSPLSVQAMGPMQVWRYFSEEPAYGKKKTYHLVWFQNGQVVKWETREEETVPRAPASTP